MRIWVIDRDGGNQTALAAVPNGGSPLDVTWAPDGRSLVVVERDYPTYRLVQLPLDGGASDVLATFTGSGPISTVSDCPVSWRRLPTP